VRELDGDRAADPARGAGDQGNLFPHARSIRDDVTRVTSLYARALFPRRHRRRSARIYGVACVLQ
jgi:hypothetical protein